MVNWSKLYALTRFFPEMQRADKLTSNRQKVIYTTTSLLIILAANQLPLYGIPVQLDDAVPEALYWGHPFFASNYDSLLALGIGPILLAEITTQILVASKAISEARTLQAQKLMGIWFTILGTIAHVVGICSLAKVGTGNAVLVLLQILFSGIVVIYVDDILKKGYGMLSSVSLFTATTICGNILWKAFSPMIFIYPDHGTEYEGAVPAWVHLMITRTDKFSAMHEAFYRQNLPNVTSLLATCLFLLIAISFQGLSSIVLPVRTYGIPRFQVNCLIKISHILYGPIILHRLLISFLYNFSKLLCMKYGENKLLNLLSTWKRSSHFREPFLAGGILYCITTTPTLADLHRAPFHAFIYVVYMLGACAYLSQFWLRVCASSKRFIDGFIVEEKECLPNLTQYLGTNSTVMF